MQTALVRAALLIVAAGELAWSVAYYVRPDLALGALGRHVIDPVIARQYPLYLASVALGYALAATGPRRYRGFLWVGIAQRAVELLAACLDRAAGAIGERPFLGIVAIEVGLAVVFLAALRAIPQADRPDPLARDRRDLGLRRFLIGFGCLELFWFLASTIFVHFGSSLLAWKLQDLYTTQQQGIGLLVIGLASLLAASDVARYRIFVWVPVASQVIGIANAFNEIRIGSIGWNVAAIQWTIEGTIVAAFAYFARRRAPTSRESQVVVAGQ